MNRQASNNVEFWKRPHVLACCFVVVSMFGCMTEGNAQSKSLWLIAGQSNAVGQGDSTLSPVCEVGSAWEYVYASDVLIQLADPVGERGLNFEAAHSGSIAPAFAKTFSTYAHKPVVVIAAARGGSACHRRAELNNYGTWDTSGDLLLFDAAIQKVKAAEKKTKESLEGIVWLQGERDANAINAGTLTAAEYEQSLVDLVNRFRKSLGDQVPFYIVQTGYYTDHPREGFDAVREAQRHVATALKNTFIAYTETHTFEARGWMKDQIHYNQTGLNHIGTTVAEVISKRNDQ
ncbi:sialate O-acetylesterase [Chryseolinea lacunae]|uniref:Sialate O-acetylesterase domain-containing protein n=1 Tax=Chryseolinea lacunae TaxID=2801331 RepID=A0ABS1KUJ7_9BACT|nr:sialate O-acetylesterase [Chryseolinea lacunae]MBL0743111.1 hypothetical protein [Chryseolinea lacunae]